MSNRVHINFEKNGCMESLQYDGCGLNKIESTKSGPLVLGYTLAGSVLD